MLVKLNKCVVVVPICNEGIVVIGVCLRRFCLSMSVVWEIVCFELGQGTTGCSGKCCFGVMYCEWYGVCDFVVLSVVEVCADYGGVNVFRVCLNLASSMVLGFVSMSVV